MQLLSEFTDRRTSHRSKDVTSVMTTAFADIRATSCKRLNAMKHTAEVARFDQLIASRAWTEAALALIAIELPLWRLRRLIYDEGEWHCALSSQRDMPDWLDSSVETHHPDMAMAILDALRDVMRSDASSHLTTAPAAWKQLESFEPVLCENYA